MKWIKVIAILAVLTLVAACFPRPAFLSTFKNNYKPKGALASARCNICHVGTTKKLNPYGAALKKKMGSAKAPTAATFKAVEKMGSFGKNIKAGKLPAG
jgi:hypothetical protein